MHPNLHRIIMNMSITMTLAEENYLKNIFHLEARLKSEVSTNTIAESMDTKPSSVTDMIQKLAEKDLLIYQKYKGVQLTDEGRKAAAGIIRKHRLWEVFLAEKLKFNWDEVHDIAEQLEHIQSRELIERLDRFLGYPKIDPHGDPIPDKDGHLKVGEKKALSKLLVNERGICVGVKESDADFLQYLNKKEIRLGTELEVLEIESFDGSIKIGIDGKELFLTRETAENIFVQSL